MVMPAGALGQAPDFRERVSEDSVDPDFCGTGVSVDVHDEFLIQGWVTDTTVQWSNDVRLPGQDGRPARSGS
jgi:hypothetical protein